MRKENPEEILLGRIRALNPLYTHYLITSLGVRKSNTFVLLYATVTLGQEDTLRKKKPSLELPDCLLLISEIRPINEIRQLIENLKKLNQIQINNNIINIEEKNTIDWYELEIDKGMYLYDTHKDLGLILRFTGKTVGETVQSLDYDLNRMIRSHPKRLVSHLSELGNVIFKHPLEWNLAICVDFIAMTQSTIEEVYIETGCLHIHYQVPESIVNDSDITAVLISDNLAPKELQFTGPPGIRSEIVPNKPKTLRISERLQISNWDDAYDNDTTDLRVNLYHKNGKVLLDYYETKLKEPELEISISSIFSETHQYVNRILEKIKPDLAKELDDVIVKHQANPTEITYKIIAQVCRTIIQETLDVLLTDDMIPEKETRPSADNTREKLSIILEWVRKKIEGGLEKERLHSDSTYDYFFNYQKTFQDLINRHGHKIGADVTKEELNRVLIHMYVWLAGLFRLLERAGRSWD